MTEEEIEKMYYEFGLLTYGTGKRTTQSTDRENEMLREL